MCILRHHLIGSLSMRWHLSRKTGEVIRVMDRGVQSITMILKWATRKCRSVLTRNIERSVGRSVNCTKACSIRGSCTYMYGCIYVASHILMLYTYLRCSQVLFNIFPVIFDIAVAIVFFCAVFNLWTGLIVLLTMAGYLGRFVKRPCSKCNLYCKWQLTKAIWPI